MSQTPPPTSPRKLSSGLWSMVRILLWLVVLLAFGVLVFLGLTYLEQKAIVPAQRSLNQVDRLANRQAEDAGLLSEYQARIAALESEILAYDERLAELEAQNEQLSVRLEELSARLIKLPGMQEHLATLQAEQTSLLESNRQAQQAQASRVRAALLINRAAQHLDANNQGLAQESLAQARDILEDFRSSGLPEARQWIERLDSAVNHLPAGPGLASAELDLLWQIILSESAPAAPATGMLTPTPVETLMPTPTPAIGR